ncbi:gag-pol polyprotein [Tanacetum coccineum]
MAGLLFNKYKGDRVKVLLVKGIWQGSATHLKSIKTRNSAVFKEKKLPSSGTRIQTTIPQNAAFQTDDLDAYDSDCDDISSAKAVLMANLSSYNSDVLSEETKTVNESLTAEHERYKERVKTFEQGLNVDLSSREKLIDSQMDDMIRNRNALKQEIELNEVKTVFNQMKVVVEQCSVDKKYFDIQKKELSLDNDRLLDHIICQDVLNIVMHADSVHVNVETYRTDLHYRWKHVPLTRITSTKIEPLKETTSKSVTTPNPEFKIYSKKTKVAKSVDLSSEPSILGSRPSNISEPNKHWIPAGSKSHLFSSISDSVISDCKDYGLWRLSDGKCYDFLAMASKQFSSGPEPQLLTPRTHNSGLVPNPPSPTPYVPPTKKDFVAPNPADLTGSPSSNTIDQDAPSLKRRQRHLTGTNRVDDIIFALTDPALYETFSEIMCSKFKMSMMGKISFFHGLQISQSPKGVFLNQSKYALEIIKKYGMETSDPVITPCGKFKLDADPQWERS